MLWATFSLCLSVVVSVAILLGARHPSKPKWAGDLMVQYVWVIVILGLAAIGLSLLIFAFSGDAPPIATQEYILSLAVVAGTAIFIKLLRVKKKLAAYAAGRQAA
jgi:hypothetical protein